MVSIDSRATKTPVNGVSVAQVYATIADVLDPELDEPLVKLGFVDQVIVRERDVTLIFKLPTYWCAPNFAYLMASDLRNCVQALPGIEAVHVVLLDHFAEDEINKVRFNICSGNALPVRTTSPYFLWNSCKSRKYFSLFADKYTGKQKQKE